FPRQPFVSKFTKGYAYLFPISTPFYCSSKEILIVEDNEDCREPLAILVKRLGYAVVEAAMGLAAIDQGWATHPDLILMDLGLPGITGDEATALLKAHPSTSNIPVVINTAFNVGAYTNRALDAGAVEILHKPLELSTLQ